jgi:hypothetical protein
MKHLVLYFCSLAVCHCFQVYAPHEAHTRSCVRSSPLAATDQKQQEAQRQQQQHKPTQFNMPSAYEAYLKADAWRAAEVGKLVDSWPLPLGWPFVTHSDTSSKRAATAEQYPPPVLQLVPLVQQVLAPEPPVGKWTTKRPSRVARAVAAVRVLPLRVGIRLGLLAPPSATEAAARASSAAAVDKPAEQQVIDTSLNAMTESKADRKFAIEAGGGRGFNVDPQTAAQLAADAAAAGAANGSTSRSNAAHTDHITTVNTNGSAADTSVPKRRGLGIYAMPWQQQARAGSRQHHSSAVVPTPAAATSATSTAAAAAAVTTPAVPAAHLKQTPAPTPTTVSTQQQRTYAQNRAAAAAAAALQQQQQQQKHNDDTDDDELLFYSIPTPRSMEITVNKRLPAAQQHHDSHPVVDEGSWLTQEDLLLKQLRAERIRRHVASIPREFGQRDGRAIELAVDTATAVRSKQDASQFTRQVGVEPLLLALESHNILGSEDWGTRVQAATALTRIVKLYPAAAQDVVDEATGES